MGKILRTGKRITGFAGVHILYSIDRMALFVRPLTDDQEHWAVNPGTFVVRFFQI